MSRPCRPMRNYARATPDDWPQSIKGKGRHPKPRPNAIRSFSLFLSEMRLPLGGPGALLGLPKRDGVGARRWATNLGGGSTQNGRDSAAKRLGVKLGNGRGGSEE